MAKVRRGRKKTRRKDSGGGAGAAGKAKEAVAGSFDAIMAAAGGGKLAGIASTLGGAYLGVQALDMAGDWLTEILTDKTNRQLKLAEKQQEGTREARNKLLKFYEKQESEAQGREEMKDTLGLIGMLNELRQGQVMSSAPGGLEGPTELALAKSGAATGTGGDILYPAMQELAARRAQGIPPSPLLLLGINA